MKLSILSLALLVCQIGFATQIDTSGMSQENSSNNIIQPAKKVIERLIGKRVYDIEFLSIPNDNGFETFEVEAKNGKLLIKGSSTVAFCYGFSTYLKEACHSMATWGGEHINIRQSGPILKRNKLLRLINSATTSMW